MRRLTSWSTRPTEVEEDYWEKLKEVYESVEDIDLYVGTTDCEAIENKDDLSVVGAELMKGEEGAARDICILNKDGNWVLEPVTLNECGGFGCCRFSFVNQPAE